jgi:hypothetical protein
MMKLLKMMRLHLLEHLLAQFVVPVVDLFVAVVVLKIDQYFSNLKLKERFIALVTQLYDS